MLLNIAACIIVSCTLVAGGASPARASSATLEDQVVAILSEEAAQGKIRVVVWEFSDETAPGAATPSETGSKDAAAGFTQDFTARLMDRIKEAGKRERIAVIDRSALNDVPRERKAPATESVERTAIETGRRAGIDVIVTGSIQRAGGSMTASAKVIRVKDGEILDIVKQDRQEKTSPAQAPIALLNAVEKIEIGSYKAFPLQLPAAGTISVTVDVLSGNPVDVTVIPAEELEHYKEQKEFKKTVLLTAHKKKSYSRSAELGGGGYYLIVRDSSLGIFSVQNSTIKVSVTLIP